MAKAQEPTLNKGGRPNDFSQEIADDICERLANGESLRSFTGPGRPDHLPAETTVRRWLAGTEDWNEQFRRQYAHARDCQADHYADRIVDDALTATDAALGRLKMDALKWAASKLAPKKYGDRQVIEHEGAISSLSDEQLDARIAEKLKAVNAG